MQAAGSFFRDANHVPITTDGIPVVATQTLVASGATAATPIFDITGNVEVRALWAVVTTTLGANQTAAFWRLNDQTAQPAITLATGTAISGAVAGSSIVKKGLAAAALVYNNNSAGRVTEPTTVETTYFSPFVITQKTAAATNIEFVYTTSDTPTSGVLQHFIRYLPLSVDANVVVLSS